MDRDGFDRRAARGAARLVFIVLGGGAWAAGAWGQAAPAEAASAPSERARRDAERPYQWILLHSDKPRKARDPAGTAAPAATPAVARPARVAVPAKAVAPPAAEAAAAPASVPAPEAAAPADPPSSVVATLPPSPGGAPPLAPAAAPEPDDDELELLQQVAPSFPRGVMLDMRKGNVQVRFKVRPDGSVVEPTVLRSSHPRLNAAAMAAVVQWKFKPTQGPHEAAVELGFNLDN